MTEQEFFEHLYGKLCRSKDEHYAAQSKFSRWMHEAMREPISKEEVDRRFLEEVPPIWRTEGYAELARDTEIVPPDGIPRLLKAGTTVRITLASNMGDLGFTPNLKQEWGYVRRVTPGDGYLTNCRLER